MMKKSLKDVIISIRSSPDKARELTFKYFAEAKLELKNPSCDIKHQAAMKLLYV